MQNRKNESYEKNFRNDIKINDLAQPFLEQIIEQMTTVFDPEI